MAREYVTFKGTKHGLVLWLDPHADFNDILEQLRKKLMLARSFWQGVTVALNETERKCHPEEKAQLEELMGEFGMALREDMENTSGEQQAEAGEPDQASRDTAIIVRRTLRSGQSIHHAGSVVVLGDVNPGAEVIAGGDIIILGTLRGVAHAGALGDENAVVVAFKLLPTQLRIAHFISRAPDHGEMPEPQGPEMAQIRNNLIMIHSYNL